MAKVTITFEDTADGEAVSISLRFEPAIQRGETGTPAQRTAVDCHEYLARQIAAEAERQGAAPSGPEARADG